MKTWIRILIAFAVVVVIGFAVWVFFFKEKDEVVAYNDMTEMIEYRESVGLNERFVELNSMNYFGGDKTNVISPEVEGFKKTCATRDILLSEEVLNAYDDEGKITATYMSYWTYDQMSTEIFKDILPYLNGKKVNRKAQRELSKEIKNYINSVKEVSGDLDELINFQNGLTNDASLIAQLEGRYNSLKLKYRNMVGFAGKIISKSINYINVAIYDNNFKIDTKFALYDSFGKSLDGLVSALVDREKDFSNNTYLIMSKLNAFNKGENIFTEEYTELKFLESYNKLISTYPTVLGGVLSRHYIQISEMADNTNLSEIIEGAQAPLVIVLNIIGF